MDATGRRDNAFDAVRILAALTVVVGHSWSLTGTDGVPTLGGRPIFDVAVWVFFSLSGYLVATSWSVSPRATSFLAKRFARILPALVVVVLATVFVIGPLATTLPLATYFTSSETWGYLANVTLVASYALPGVFEDSARPGVVNGVLWSLGPEVLCYLVMLAVGLLAARRPLGGTRVRGVALGAIGVLLAALALLVGPGLAGFEPVVEAGVFFMVGAVIAQLPPTRSLPLLPALVGLAVWLALGFVDARLATAVAWLALPYAVVSIGGRSIPILRRAGRLGDPSYGVYLWGFPLQQGIVTAAPGLPLPAVILLSIVAATAFGFASWHGVEQPTLRRVRGALRAVRTPPRVSE